jgi:hypothetical protein
MRLPRISGSLPFKALLAVFLQKTKTSFEGNAEVDQAALGVLGDSS